MSEVILCKHNFANLWTHICPVPPSLPAMMSVCVPSPHSSSPSMDAANCNGPTVTPPTSLSLRSSHNQLLSGEVVVNQGQATPPKCRKKYALMSIQSAMGLGDGTAPSSPSSLSSVTGNATNLKLAKNGANQLRKAAELQDQNKNTTSEEEAGNVAADSDHELELSIDSQTEADDYDEPANEDAGDFLNAEERAKDSNTNPFEEDSDELLILSEKTELLGKSPEIQKAKIFLESHGDDLLPDEPRARDYDITVPLLKAKDLSPALSRKQRSPEDTPLLSIGSSSASSSPETKKDRPRTGAKTDRALHRIQNLPPSDEESSWTTLSQDSTSLGSPEDTGQ